MKLSLQSRILIVLIIITIALLLVIWTVVRPKYEASVVTERLTIIQQLQNYSIENLDRTITSWSNVVRFIAWQVSERPKEGEIVLRTMMTLHPEIIQIRINSPKLTDELTSQNTSYQTLNLQVKDSIWLYSKLDTLLRIAWLSQTSSPQQIFAMRTRFQVQKIPFVITVMWNANRLHEIIAGLPLGEDYSVSVQSSSSVLVQNNSSFQPIEAYNVLDRISTLQSIQQKNTSWRVLTSAFQSVQLWMIVAVPEKIIIKPVEDLMLYSSSLIVGISFLLLILGWILSHQISQPIARLVKDVQRFGNLDFTQKIQIPAMKDLRGMGETIELMRQVLERYQRLNVEKIILEEWKNKLFMTHSDDMIGFTDGAGTFVFRNDTFEEFCSSLLPTRSLKTKSDLLTHPAITKTKETIRDEAADSLIVHLEQSELKIQIDGNTVYYRVNDLSINRSGENLGSLLIFHDLTNERLIDKMKTDMINVVVHELRNPVGSIMGFSELLLNSQNITEDERKEFTGIILSSSQNLINLINRFLDISRLESHRIESPKIPIDIVSIVQKIIDIQKPQLLKKSLTVKFEVEDQIPEVVVSPDLFREAVSNLFSNAIKYGGTGRTINISLKLVNEQLVFSILDHGYGIPPAAQEKLFKKFFRAHSVKSAGEVGTGLGLAYVKEIVAYHGGTITMESNDEIGCKFTITIPAVVQERNLRNRVEG